MRITADNRPIPFQYGTSQRLPPKEVRFGHGPVGSIAPRDGRVLREDPCRHVPPTAERDRHVPRVRDSDRGVLPAHPCAGAGGPPPLRGAGAHPEGQADLAVLESAQECVHLLRGWPAPRPVPARERPHEGLWRRLEGRRRGRATMTLTPPPQPTWLDRDPPVQPLFTLPPPQPPPP